MTILSQRENASSGYKVIIYCHLLAKLETTCCDYTRFIRHSSAAEVETLTLSGIRKTGLFKLFNVKDPKNINPPLSCEGPLTELKSQYS